MNRKHLIKAAMAVCAVIVIISVAVSVSGLFGTGALEYADAEKYTAGEAVIGEMIQSLDISWISGRVTVEYHSGDTVELTEASDKAIDEDMKLRWWLDGGTLRVQYAKKGFRMGWNREKKLTVLLPEGIALREVRVSTVSGDISIPALRAESLSLNAVSGGINACGEAKVFSSVTTSGNQVLRVTGSAERVSAASTSGRISLEADTAGEIEVSAISESIQVKAERVQRCDVHSTSGAVTADLKEADRVEAVTTSGGITVITAGFSSLKAVSTSGGINVQLPEQPGFTAKIKTTSGKIDYDMPLSRQGDVYVCGDGSAEVEISATSGNIFLNAAER